MSTETLSRAMATLAAGAVLATACGQPPQQRTVAPLDCDDLAVRLAARSQEVGRTCKISMERGLLDVELLGAELPPAMGLTSWVAMLPVEPDTATLIGDLVLTSDEFPGVLRGIAAAEDLLVTAVHRHMMGENPPIHYVHIAGNGPAPALVGQLRDALDREVTALGVAPTDSLNRPIGLVAGTLCNRLEAILSGEPTGTVKGPAFCKVTIPRERLAVEIGGVDLPAAMGLNAWFAFRETREGDAAVVTGDIPLTPEQVNPVIDRLEASEIDVVAVHNHMLFESPRLIYVHVQARGGSDDLARAIRGALDLVEPEAS